MVTENFRTIHNGTEIATLIQQAREEEYGQIWQTVGPLRQTYQITSVHVSKENEALLFETLAPFDFNREYPVYVRITHRNVIFKLHQNFETKKNRMICSIPHEAKASEFRINERFHVPENKNIMLKLKPLSGVASEVEVKLDNFSQSGMGITISHVNKDFFERISLFSILAMGGIKMGDRKVVQVKYLKATSKDSIRVGLTLIEPFDKGTFSYLQNLLL